MDSSPSGLEILSLRRVVTESRWYIGSWVFYWTLKLFSNFMSKQSHSDLLFHMQTPYLKQFSLGIFHAVRENITVSCSSPLPVHRSLWPQPPASIWQVPTNAPSWDTPGTAFTSWALSWQFWMQHLSMSQRKSVPRRLFSSFIQDEGFGR